MPAFWHSFLLLVSSALEPALAQSTAPAVDPVLVLVGGEPYLIEIHERSGGAFVVAASMRADFTRALRQKMILEIADTTTSGITATGLD